MAPKHWHGKHAGSKAILNYMKSKKPSFVFCGHIHEGEGHFDISGSKVYNLGVAGCHIVHFNRITIQYLKEIFIYKPGKN